MSGQILNRLNKWTRDIHVSAGLFASPFVLLFALTAILFNHTWAPGSSSKARSWEKDHIEIREDLADLKWRKRFSRSLLSQARSSSSEERPTRMS